MSATPQNSQKSNENRWKKGCHKRPRKKHRQIDTVRSHVLKLVAKGQPKGSKLEPEAEPNSSKIDALASYMQQSVILLSQEAPGGGYRLKKHRKSTQKRWKHIDKLLTNPTHNASTQDMLADILAEFPLVQAAKPRPLFQDSFGI